MGGSPLKRSYQEVGKGLWKKQCNYASNLNHGLSSVKIPRPPETRIDRKNKNKVKIFIMMLGDTLDNILM